MAKSDTFATDRGPGAHRHRRRRRSTGASSSTDSARTDCICTSHASGTVTALSMPPWAPDIGRDTAAQGAESRTGNSPTSFTRRSTGFGPDEAQQCTLESTGKEARTPTRRAQSSRHSEPGISVHVFVATTGARDDLRAKWASTIAREIAMLDKTPGRRGTGRNGQPAGRACGRSGRDRERGVRR